MFLRTSLIFWVIKAQERDELLPPYNPPNEVIGNKKNDMKNEYKMIKKKVKFVQSKVKDGAQFFNHTLENVKCSIAHPCYEPGNYFCGKTGVCTKRTGCLIDGCSGANEYCNEVTAACMQFTECDAIDIDPIDTNAQPGQTCQEGQHECHIQCTKKIVDYIGAEDRFFERKYECTGGVWKVDLCPVITQENGKQCTLNDGGDTFECDNGLACVPDNTHEWNDFNKRDSFVCRPVDWNFSLYHAINMTLRGWLCVFLQRNFCPITKDVSIQCSFSAITSFLTQSIPNHKCLDLIDINLNYDYETIHYPNFKFVVEPIVPDDVLYNSFFGGWPLLKNKDPISPYPVPSGLPSKYSLVDGKVLPPTPISQEIKHVIKQLDGERFLDDKKLHTKKKIPVLGYDELTQEKKKKERNLKRIQGARKYHKPVRFSKTGPGLPSKSYR